MIFSVSNDGMEWFLDFGSDPVDLTKKDLVHELIEGSREIPLAAWSLLFSQKQDFLNVHLAQAPVTRNQGGDMQIGAKCSQV